MKATQRLHVPEKTLRSFANHGGLHGVMATGGCDAEIGTGAVAGTALVGPVGVLVPAFPLSQIRN